MRDLRWLALTLAVTWAVVGCGGSGGAKAPSRSATTPTAPVAFQLSASTVSVPEGRTQSVSVRLSASPGHSTAVSIEKVSGDPDLTLEMPPTLSFGVNAWNVSQRVEIAAAPDADKVNGTATFRLSATNVTPIDIVVTEADDDQQLDSGLLVVEGGPLQVPEGGTGALRVRLSRPPTAPVAVVAEPDLAALAVASGGSLVFNGTNWDQSQSVVFRAATDADSCNAKGAVRLLSGGAEQLALDATILDTSRPAGVTNLLCGTIAAPEIAVIDRDVNDGNAPYSSNDQPSLAQPVPNPVTIGGYVNVAGSGPQGRSMAAGDPSDFYIADFAAGQSIVLHVADSANADLDLYLYDTAGTLVDSSLGLGAVEVLTIASSGTYLLEVYACSTADRCALNGGSNYLLTFGQAAPVQGGQSLTLGDPFVPGEVVARWKEAGVARALAASPALLAGSPERGALVDVSAAGASGLLRALAGARQVKFASVEQQAKFETLMSVKQLRSQPDVAAADPNYLLQPLATPNDPLYAVQWHYPQINLPQAWDMTTGSDQVVVGVIDTGVLVAHPDLQGKLAAGYDFIRDPNNSGDGDGIDANPDDPGDGGGVAGSSFHGTHTSGTVGALSNNNLGVAGVAWGAKVMPLRALGRSGGTEFDAQESLRFAAGLANSAGTLPAKRADVVNMSFGGPRFSQTTADLIAEVRAAGVVVVAAAGNDATADAMYPAAYDGVIGVSAVDFDRNLAPYSNFGPSIDVAAPGGDTRRDRNGDGVGDGVTSSGGSDTSGSIQFRYPVFQGTSMAAPHVAGVIALMKSVNPGLTPVDVDNLLAAGRITQDLGGPGRDDQFGFGLIDAFKAVTEAAALAGGGAPVPDPRLVVQPSALNLGSSLSSARVTVSNGGGGQLSVMAVTSDQPWLVTRPIAVDGSGRGSYDVQVNRAGLAPGTYTGNVQVTSSAGTAAVSVIMQVSGQVMVSDAGFHYVVLYEPETHRVLTQATAQARNGVYQFTLTNPPRGVYHVFAGTDSNQDGFLCDAGEACGAYTTVAQPVMVVIDGADVGGVDFSTNFVLDFSGTPLAAGQKRLPHPISRQ